MIARSHLEGLGSPAIVGAPKSSCAGVAAVDAGLLVGSHRGVGLASDLGLRSHCVALGARASPMVRLSSSPSGVLFAGSCTTSR